jgi:hypothetical protein
MTQPNDTEVLEGIAEAADERGYALLTVTAQQAVLPRKLEEGVYAILDAEGGIQVRETDGYAQQRIYDWGRARADTVEFVHRNVTLLDVDSFIDYLARNTKDEPVKVEEDYLYNAGGLELWASIDDRNIKAILDGMDGLRKHTATLALRKSREWDEWIGIDGKLLPQVDFAEFIDSHLSTIAHPDGALLLDICQTLEAHKTAQFKQQNILANGQRQFRWEEQVEATAGAKGDLTIPGELQLVLRPFQGAAGVPVTARFRYRINEGVLKIGIKLVEPDVVLEQAFDLVVTQVQEQVPVHVNHGRP